MTRLGSGVKRRGTNGVVATRSNEVPMSFKIEAVVDFETETSRMNTNATRREQTSRQGEGIPSTRKSREGGLNYDGSCATYELSTSDNKFKPRGRRKLDNCDETPLTLVTSATRGLPSVIFNETLTYAVSRL